MEVIKNHAEIYLHDFEKFPNLGMQNKEIIQYLPFLKFLAAMWQ
jgi:hypothetical protein